MRPITYAVIALCLSLTACSKAADQPSAAAPPADAPAPAPVVAAPGPFAGDFNLAGTEPFWALEIRKTTLKLSRPDAADLTVDNPGPKVEGTKAVWPGKGLAVTLTAGDCSDGMSDKTYPYYAEVTIVDATLKGCATGAP